MSPRNGDHAPQLQSCIASIGVAHLDPDQGFWLVDSSIWQHLETTSIIVRRRDLQSISVVRMGLSNRFSVAA